MESEDKEMFEDVLEEMQSKEVEGFLIVLEFKDGSRRACYSDISVELFDHIKNDIEANRKMKTGEWTQKEMAEWIHGERVLTY